MPAIFTSQVSANTFVMLSIAFAAGLETLMRRSRLFRRGLENRFSPSQGASFLI